MDNVTRTYNEKGQLAQTVIKLEDGSETVITYRENGLGDEIEAEVAEAQEISSAE